MVRATRRRQSTHCADSGLSIRESSEVGERSGSGIARHKKRPSGLPSDVFAVIEKQVDGAQRKHDQIRALINAARECSWLFAPHARLHFVDRQRSVASTGVST